MTSTNHEQAMVGHDGPTGLAISAAGYTLAPATTRFTIDQPQPFSFRILDPDGHPVRAFQPTHERAMHLIVVRRDLVGFQHLHPQLDADGRWSTQLSLPAAGVYRAFADFATTTGPATLGVDLFAAGAFDPVELPAPEPAARTGDYQITLDAGELPSGLRFGVDRGGRPVTDLEPYLGTLGHLVALRVGDLAFLHVHPEATTTSGPSIEFHASFPSAGHYRLFLQFQHQGTVHTVAFTIAR